MNGSISFSDLLLLGGQPEENVTKLIAEGAQYIELLLDGAAWNEMGKEMDRVAPFLLNSGVSYSIHPPAWDTNLSSENKAIRETSYEEYMKSVQFAHRIGASSVVIHPGFCFSPSFCKRTAAERAEEAVGRLCAYAAQLGVRLAVENVGYRGSSLFTQDEYVQFVGKLDETAVYLIDTGHAHLNGWDIPQLIRQTRDRLGCVHLHDNFGNADEHLPIGDGSIAWQPIWDALQGAPNCQLILEYAPGTAAARLWEGQQLLRSVLKCQQV